MMRISDEKNGNNAEDLSVFQPVPITNLFFVLWMIKERLMQK